MVQRTLLPAGMADVLPPQADHEAATVRRLMAGFASYGYEAVKPPLMEFEDRLLAGAGAALAPQAFRLMDPISQRMLALRPDVTMQVARIATERLNRRPRPLRLAYAGQVVHVNGTATRSARQVGQVGAELIGVGPPDADAEVIVMAAGVLADLGIGSVTVDLGIPTLVPALLAGESLDPALRRRLRTALDRKDAGEVVGLVRPQLGAGRAALLARLVALAGPAETVLDALMRLDLPPAAASERAALAAVAATARALASALGHPAIQIGIDPVENRGFEYHTGVTFALFAEGVAAELGRGGRYHAGTLGAGEPATGVTLFLDVVLASLPPPAEGPRRVFVPVESGPEMAAQLRRDGWIAIAALAPAADATAEARRLGCSHVALAGAVRPVEPADPLPSHNPTEFLQEGHH
ncbi:MAG: ATP phosphoribosyltransferase regulatory subunit [Rhodospirillales bacterium]|nr:MAG: ATP phosphoribosyltransferase regulatory subunit [Rhodospirillales bacterium]